MKNDILVELEKTGYQTYCFGRFIVGYDENEEVAVVFEAIDNEGSDYLVGDYYNVKSLAEAIKIARDHNSVPSASWNSAKNWLNGEYPDFNII